MPHPGQPPDRVLDLFVAEGVLEPLPGGRGATWRAGDLALSPGRDGSRAWLAPVQARLAVRLDEESPRTVRLALPVPARDGSLVVDGWSATRFEPGTTPCRDLPVLRATAHLLHARLAVAVAERPEGLDASVEEDDRRSRAERAAYDPERATREAADRSEPGILDLVSRLVDALDGLEAADLGREQLVHHDLAGHVLLDATGVPFVVGLSPSWRSPLWAEAVCVLDAVLWHGAPVAALEEWSSGPARQAMLRAAAFGVLSDQPCDVARYAGLGLV